MRVLKLLWIFIDRVVCKCHSDNALFRFFIDRILFRVLSDRVLLESSLIESSSEFADRFFSWIINALFQPCRYFLSISATIFIKKDVLFYIHYISKNTLTCSNNFNNTDRKNINHIISACMNIGFT